jgi:hypothetical protein
MSSLNHADMVIFDFAGQLRRVPGHGHADCRLPVRPSGVHVQPEGEYDGAALDAVASSRKQTRGQAGIRADFSHDSFRAEHFSCDLKMLKRAMVMGETTGGAAHAGVFHRIDDHFRIGISEPELSILSQRPTGL